MQRGIRICWLYLPTNRGRLIAGRARSGSATSTPDVDAFEGSVPVEDLAVGGGKASAPGDGASHDQPVGEIVRRALPA